MSAQSEESIAEIFSQRRHAGRWGSRLVTCRQVRARAAKAGAARQSITPGRQCCPTVAKEWRRPRRCARACQFRLPFPMRHPLRGDQNGRPVPGGVGPRRDITAFSTLCTHMGCPTAYDAGQRVFRCPCHFSLFDAELGGQMVCGQATVDLPGSSLSTTRRSDTLLPSACAA